MKASVLAAPVPTTILGTVMARPVEDKPLETKLTVEEMFVRADSLFNRFSISPEDIFSARTMENSSTGEKFIRVSLRGTTEAGEFLNLYLNDNGRASFYLGNRDDMSKIGENEFVKALASLEVRPSKAVQY